MNKILNGNIDLSDNIIFVIYDTVARRLHHIFIAGTDDEASRFYISYISDERNPIHRHSSDFLLYKLCKVNLSSLELFLLNKDQSPVFVDDGVRDGKES